MKVACFLFWCFLCEQNLFVKKINSLEIVLITSFCYTTDVYAYQLTYRVSIYTHLFLFVTICDNLIESYLFMIICDNLFFKVLMKITKRMNSIIWKKSFFSSKTDDDILLISYVPILCFLLWILLILCLIISLLNRVSLNSLSSVARFAPFAVLDSLLSISSWNISLTVIQKTH